MYSLFIYYDNYFNRSTIKDPLFYLNIDDCIDYINKAIDSYFVKRIECELIIKFINIEFNTEIRETFTIKYCQHQYENLINCNDDIIDNYYFNINVEILEELFQKYNFKLSCEDKYLLK